MQPTQLTLTHLFERAERYSTEKKIITATATGKTVTTYGEWAARTRLLGGVIDNLKIAKHGRV
ncbi:MAG: fatty acid--CoA ligase, partial [Actinomycetota bacterium]